MVSGILKDTNMKPSSNYIAQRGGQDATTIIFSLKEEVGALANALSTFKKYSINLLYIESRLSNRQEDQYEFLVDCEVNGTDEEFRKAIDALKGNSSYLNIISRDQSKHKDAVPFFPRSKKELDVFANQTLTYGDKLNADHPGFTDEIYRKRRKEFADIAHDYTYGQPVPRVEYTDLEIKTWNTIYTKLNKLYPTHACKEFNDVFPLLEQNCGYSADNVPQLEDVSNFLKRITGFTLRPVAGLLSSRDFLAGLAFRVFHSTQYIRHHSRPLYTPEPDVCHELIGHVPMFANPAFAEFSQLLGLASLGASDEYIEKLATCYWFTIEFGICRQNGQLKAFGAGLLSSFGELEYSLSDEPKHLNFIPEIVGTTKYPITSYQPVYFVTESFEDAKDKLREFASTIPKPFVVRYEPYTECIEILDTKVQITRLLSTVNKEIKTLTDAVDIALS